MIGSRRWVMLNHMLNQVVMLDLILHLWAAEISLWLLLSSLEVA